ncbi:MAG: topoisomerase C-terminal repeat-containing protein, partial [Chroococcales cyanobacterium]
ARSVELENLDAKVRIGRYGPYIEADNGDGVVTASIPKDLTPSDLDPEQVQLILKQKTEGPEQLGTDPTTGLPIYIMIGKYGPYVQLGEATEENKKPKRASFPKGVTAENLTLDQAVGLLALPRTLGVHPENGGKIQASLGRFGPYVVCDRGKEEGKEYRSLKAGDDVLSITLPRALELLAEPKKGRSSKSSKAKEPLRELGKHPADDEPVNVYDGPYGPYVKHGKTNASVPEGTTVEDVTLAQAVELLAAKASTSKSKSKSKSSSKSKTSTTKSKTGTTKKKSTTSTAKKKS